MADIRQRLTSIKIYWFRRNFFFDQDHNKINIYILDVPLGNWKISYTSFKKHETLTST